MSQLIFLSSSLSNAMMFCFMSHPMSMGMILLTQTILACLITNNISQTPWFSYILFIVFLGGMLVLFIYMTSVASNDIMKKSNIFWGMIIITTMILMMMITIDPTLLPNNTSETLNILDKSDLSKMTMSMFNYPNTILTNVAVLYLFLTLIVVVKMTESHQGPLRKN